MVYFLRVPKWRAAVTERAMNMCGCANMETKGVHQCHLTVGLPLVCKAPRSKARASTNYADERFLYQGATPPEVGWL